MDQNKDKSSIAVQALIETKDEAFGAQALKLKEVIARQEMILNFIREGERTSEKLLNHDFTNKIEKFNFYTEKINKIRIEMTQINYKVDNLRKRISKLEDIRLKELQDIDSMKKSQETMLNDIIAKPPE